MLVTYRRLPVVDDDENPAKDMSQPTGPMEEHTVRIEWDDDQAQMLDEALAEVAGDTWSGVPAVGQAGALDNSGCFFHASVTISRRVSPHVYVSDNAYGHGLGVAYIYHEQTNDPGIPKLAESGDIDDHPALHLTTRVLYGFESIDDACDHIREAWTFWDDELLNPISATVFSNYGNQAPIF